LATRRKLAILRKGDGKTWEPGESWQSSERETAKVGKIRRKLAILRNRAGESWQSGESWQPERASLSGSMDQVAVELTALLGWLRTFNLSSEVSYI
jgi:hypothetical protein